MPSTLPIANTGSEIKQSLPEREPSISEGRNVWKKSARSLPNCDLRKWNKTAAKGQGSGVQVPILTRGEVKGREGKCCTSPGPAQKFTPLTQR